MIFSNLSNREPRSRFVSSIHSFYRTRGHEKLFENPCFSVNERDISKYSPKKKSVTVKKIKIYIYIFPGAFLITRLTRDFDRERANGEREKKKKDIFPRRLRNASRSDKTKRHARYFFFFFFFVRGLLTGLIRKGDETQGETKNVVARTDRSTPRGIRTSGAI